MNVVATKGSRLAGPHALPVQAYTRVARVCCISDFTGIGTRGGKSLRR
jgi:hypothetical protein